MNNYKTISLTGTEQTVKINGDNCDIRNDSADTVYASGKPNIIPGADGVLSIPAGQGAKLFGCCGTLYILGTGSVMLCGNDYAELVFKSAATSSGGGGTVDDVARQSINTHTANADIHFTAEKAIKAAATTISNPNLIDNPDFKINQRGQTQYTAAGYTVDRWRLAIVPKADNPSAKVAVDSKGITISAVDCNAYLYIDLEHVPLGNTVTLSVSVNDAVYSATVNIPDTPPESDTTLRLISTAGEGRVADISLLSTGNLRIQVSAMMGMTNHFEWVKLEYGSAATPFILPNPATELAKCQRYYQRLGGSASSTGTFGTGFIGGTSYATVNIGLANPMRIAPTITITGEMCLATAGHNGANGVIRTSSWIAGWHSTTSSATVVLDISHVADETIVGNACLLQIRDNGSYIELSADL